MSRRYQSPLTREGQCEIEQLTAFFSGAERPDQSTHLVGTELEKFGVAVGGSELRTARHADHIVPVLEGFIRDHGWQKVPDVGENDALVELHRDGASITLEPGGQLELSGKPLHNVHETCAEFSQHYDELHAVSQPLGVAWMTAGHQPWATREEIDWVPKGRYRIMREYLPTRGKRALDMMVRTCTVQANFDYASERECGERYRLALLLAPFVGAAFANSPYEEGRRPGPPSLRPGIWCHVDPDRCGTPPFVFDGQPFSYGRYVDWALDVPMFFVRRGDTYHRHHATFRTFMREGFTDPAGAEHCATTEDWELHLSTLFPDARLKPFIEVRTADAVGSKFVCALPALWKGLLYDPAATAEAAGLIPDGEREALSSTARRRGLEAPEVREICKRMLAISRVSLDRMNVRDGKGRTESRFLDRLETLVDASRSPGDEAIDQLGDEPGADAGARRRFLAAFHFAGAAAA